ncbi:molybdopterin molybdotransferase MoeA [Cellulomonas composti]|uniref:Molybdopterin molybdenumtransferase n=1 Tax=Cellulomonas composti TaxID=266130 RepID=A0A511JE48_9CELL|nr:gephyrin-like molybdotransferase Glp [Cellulomonas composti]GEL96069.1 molybdopterin molybdenumtransferase MoeA [Cellulomonas composti]
MRGLDEHRAATLALAAPLPAVEVGLLDALGLVLAADVVTDEVLPRWDNSAMDGYAALAADVARAAPDAPVALRVVGDLAAGSADEPTVVAGTAVRIMTGAPVPPGADAVLPVELTRPADPRVGAWAEVGGVVEAVQRVEPGANVRRAGEDAAPGDLVLTAGALVGPAHVAAAASVGRATLVVHRRPRIAVISTGDELVAPGEPLPRGRIPDSNSWLLAAAVQEAGATALRLGPTSDDPDELRALVAALDDGRHGTVDGIVTSGGVSVGAFDVVKAALTGVEFVSVAVQPGKPQGLGRLPGGTPIWTLPGNPVSSFASFEAFVRPAIRRMLGLVDVERPRFAAVAADGWRTPPGRAQLMPVRLTEPDEPGAVRRGDDGRVRVWRATSGGSGSHLVARLAVAQGLAVVPADVPEVRPGDTLEVFLT